MTNLEPQTGKPRSSLSLAIKFGLASPSGYFGEIISVCPMGALSERNARAKRTQTVLDSVCTASRWCHAQHANAPHRVSACVLGLYSSYFMTDECWRAHKCTLGVLNRPWVLRYGINCPSITDPEPRVRFVEFWAGCIFSRDSPPRKPMPLSSSKRTMLTTRRQPRNARVQRTLPRQ